MEADAAEEGWLRPLRHEKHDGGTPCSQSNADRGGGARNKQRKVRGSSVASPVREVAKRSVQVISETNESSHSCPVRVGLARLVFSLLPIRLHSHTTVGELASAGSSPAEMNKNKVQ
jgi:hypothetical protein